MSEISYLLSRVALKSEGLRRIADLFRPSAIEAAQWVLENYPADSPESMARQMRLDAEEVIASGGLRGISGGIDRLRSGNQTTTRSTNSGHGLDESWADVVDSADWYAASLKTSRISITLDVSPTFLNLTGSAKFALPKVADDELKEFLDSVVAIINDYPMTPEERGHRPFRVFIGHGGDQKWKTVKRLLETEDYEIEAFESETRAGYSTLETIDLMIRGSSVGVVIMTGVDSMQDGSLRARENVVHEIGYCMGALGIRNTIVLLEDGVSEFSNIRGLTQIRFPAGDIGQAIGELTAALTLRKNAAEARH